MNFETAKFDMLYGKLLAKGVPQSLAKQLATALYTISEDLGLSIDDILSNVTNNGLRFDNDVYEKLNSYRTNSSQLGFLDTNNIPTSISRQVV
jgi:hypothetical protein